MLTILLIGCLCFSSLSAMEVPLTLSSPVSAEKSDIREIFSKYGNARIAHELLVSNLAIVNNTLGVVSGALRANNLKNWRAEYCALNTILNGIYSRVSLSRDERQQQLFFRYALKWASLRHIKLLLSSCRFDGEYLLTAVDLLHESADFLLETLGKVGSRDETVPAALESISRLVARYKRCSSWLIAYIVTQRVLSKKFALAGGDKAQALVLKIARLAHLASAVQGGDLKSSLDTTEQA